MKKVVKLIVACFVFSIFPTIAIAKDARDCVTIEKVARSSECGDPGGIRAVFGNGCTVPIEIKFCLQGQNGRPSCGLQTVYPGKNHSSWVCAGTGKYWYEARVLGSDDKFDNENEINWSIR